MVTKEFATAGRAVFTLEVPAAFAAANKTATHYTYRIGFKKGANGYADAYFVSLLSGPDNTEDFTYIGMLNGGTGEFRTTGKSRLPVNSSRWHCSPGRFAGCSIAQRT